MKSLLAIALLLIMPTAHAEKIKVDGFDTPVEFINGYDLEHCLQLDGGSNRFFQMNSAKCESLRNDSAKKNAKETAEKAEMDSIRANWDKNDYANCIYGNGHPMGDINCKVLSRRYEHEEQERVQAEENRKWREERRLEQERLEAQKEQARVQRDQAFQKEQERINQLKTCEATQAYRLYESQEAVIEDIETQQNLRKAVARQKQLIKMSGVRNLSEERQIAEEQLEVQSALKEHWAEYKSDGGKAVSPQAVKHKIEDPCDSFRPEN